MQAEQFKQTNWVSLSELTTSGELSCIDGRHNHCVVGAPGGNLGEFILLLAAAEEETGYQFSAKDVQDFMDINSAYFGRFYMHTDEHAIQRLLQALKQDPRLDNWLVNISDSDQLFGLLLNAGVQYQDILLPYLVTPEFNGCGHIGLLLKHADDYGTRLALVEYAIKSFYQHLWQNHPRFKLVMLTGEHTEQSVVTIDSDTEISSDKHIPYSCNNENERQFVNHQVARDYFMRKNIPLLSQFMQSKDTRLDSDRLLLAVKNLGNRQLNLTVSQLADGLPVFEIAV